MDADAMLDAFSVKLYQAPLAELLASESPDLADPLVVAMLVVNLETEASMGGLVTYLGNTSGRHAAATVQALQLLGCTTQAELLADALKTATRAGMTHTNIQSGRAKAQTPYAVTSFTRLHGHKWERACSEVEALADQIDFDEVMDHARSFVDTHRATFDAALHRE